MTQENPTLTMIREFVALGRAEFDRPTSPSGDADAQRAITQGMTAAGPDGTPTEMVPPLLDLLAPRAPYFDQLVAPGSSLSLTAEVHPDGFDSDEVLATTDEVMFGGTSPLHSIRTRSTWLRVLDDAGWDTEDRQTVTAVNHFPVEIGDRTAQVQTHFITAHA